MSRELSYEERKAQVSQLPNDAYWVLSVLAVAWLPLERQTVAGVLSRMQLRPEGGPQFDLDLINRQLDWLQSQGYIDFENARPYAREAWSEPAARHLYLNAHAQLKSMVRGLRREEGLHRSAHTFFIGEKDRERLLKRIRLHYMSDEANLFHQQSSLLEQAFALEDQRLQRLQYQIDHFSLPIDPEFIQQRPLPFQTECLGMAFQHLQEWKLDTFDTVCQTLLGTGQLHEQEGDYLRVLLSHTLALKGVDWEPQNPYCQALKGSVEGIGLRAFSALLRQDTAQATQAFEWLQPDNYPLPQDFWGALCLFFHFWKEGAASIPQLQRKIRSIRYSHFPLLFNGLNAFLSFQKGQEEEEASQSLCDLMDEEMHPLERLWLLLFAYWCGITPEESWTAPLREQLPVWETAGLDWLAGEAANLLAALFPQSPERDQWRVTAMVLAERQGIQYLLPMVARQAPWERTLRALELVGTHLSGANNHNAKAGAKRLAWFVDMENENLQPKEQKMSKRGRWSPGRKVDLSSLQRQEVTSMTRQDRTVNEALRTRHGEALSSMYYYSEYDLSLDFGHALYLLAGHPYVYLDSEQHRPLELSRGQPELFIEEEGEQLRLQFKPHTTAPGYVVEKSTPTRYTIYKINESEAQIARAVGRGSLIPREGRKRLEASLQDLRHHLPVQSPAELEQEDLPQVEGDPLPCLHLLPFGEGFKLEFYVKPLHPEPHYFKPGEGRSLRMLQTEEGRVACQRSLEEESQLADAVIEACPSLQELPAQDYEWQVDDTETCLQVLLELFPLRENGQIRLEHPKGERVHLAGISDMSQLSIQVQQKNDWFALDGKLALNESEVLEFQRLLRHVQESDSPFVELREGEFVALTDRFREQLRELDSLLHQRGKKLELPALAGQHLDQLSEEMGDLEVDLAWAERMQRLQKAQRIRPRLPKDFRAELRSYQQEGFRWMMRLAAWGVGGCLADDMGLGKTVQALAVLAARREEGPSLVIAPASVTRNWMREARRFAPSLNAQLLDSSKDSRKISRLGKGDLLLVSYGLLPFVGDALAERTFANIVLDEAQAIKNAATKRSKIAMSLQGGFKLATTGTPIENHLGELWNLFRFLNPGLLGSWKRFNEKFAKPIARDGDEQRREQLRRLIRPFILRRRKDEVLTELPAKTEITLTVELSEPETAFYEALRRRALDEIQAADDTSKRFTLLAQLTRLRQAACHPLLVEPRSHLPSSKLALVNETLLELLDNGHKALVFSQFVQHLRLVEQWVKQQGIPYQYLDGQTPGKQREAAVNAFQRGEGELFLISLKAGGTGLNLTAADYVLHLDPWWNPAVEDQASDRAHRIGQQRPVTVYRLVSENTIEEKIVALHHQKRELADQLLAGTNLSAKLSVEEMVDLIKE